MQNMDKITGKIDETELDSLVNEDIVNGGSWGAAAAVLTAIIVATYAAGACPSSSCTKKCNK